MGILVCFLAVTAFRGEQRRTDAPNNMRKAALGRSPHEGGEGPFPPRQEGQRMPKSLSYPSLVFPEEMVCSELEEEEEEKLEIGPFYSRPDESS